jgi:hypothetical protein
MQIDHLAAPVQTSGKVGRPTKAAIGFDQLYQDSVISIRNNSNYTVYFYFRWDDKGWSALQTLKPGQGLYYIDSGAGHNGYINFMKGSSSTGWQSQTYLLSSKTALEGGFADILPQFKDGQLFTFLSPSGKLDLYRG